MQLASCKFAAVRSPATWSGQHPSLTKTAASTKKKPVAAVCCAASRRDDAEFGCGDSGWSGRQVDEGMAVLRQRIDEVRAAELSLEQPAEWAAWERELYSAYDADVWHLVGALQAVLMSDHPTVGVGLVAALALAVPASVFVLITNLLSNLPH